MKARIPLTSLLLFGLVSMATTADLRAAELIPLRTSYAAVSGNFAPIWLAQDKGFFAKYGLAVDLKFIPPITATQALLGGSLDIAMVGGEVVEAGLAGERVVYIAVVSNRVTLSLYSKPEIDTVSDLRGKVISALAPGSISDFLARILLREVGLVPGKDVKVVYLKTGPAILTALTTGTIDAGIISAPMTLKARKAGFKALVNSADKNIAMVHSAFGSTSDIVRTHPDRVKRFLQGYLEGIKVARTNPEEAKRVVGKYTNTTSEEELEETYGTFVRVWEKVPYVSSAAVQTLLDFAKHPAAKAAKPEQFIDNSILAELEKSGFVNQLYQQ